jgi:hypothetical protein
MTSDDDNVLAVLTREIDLQKRRMFRIKQFWVSSLSERKQRIRLSERAGQRAILFGNTDRETSGGNWTRARAVDLGNDDLRLRRLGAIAYRRRSKPAFLPA